MNGETAFQETGTTGKGGNLYGKETTPECRGEILSKQMENEYPIWPLLMEGRTNVKIISSDSILKI